MLFRIRAAAAEGLAGRLRLPALEDVDAAPRVEQIGGDREIETASCPASLLLRLDGDVSRNDDHGCACTYR